MSFVAHASLSEHDVFGALSASLGHAALEPLHRSATSHSPLALRHVVDAGAKRSVGHAAAVPLHGSLHLELAGGHFSFNLLLQP